MVMKNAKAASPDYFQMFKNLIDEPFLSKESNRNKPIVDRLMLRSSANNDATLKSTDFNEPFSDECYSMLLGKNHQICDFNKECFEFYSEPSASGMSESNMVLQL